MGKTPYSPPRRRSPLWVRRMSSEDLHAVAHRFLSLQTTADLTERQEWLWGALISELEYRWRRTRPTWRRCNCGLCRPPF